MTRRESEELSFLRNLAEMQWRLRGMHWQASKGDKAIRAELKALGHETKRRLAEYITAFRPDLFMRRDP